MTDRPEAIEHLQRMAKDQRVVMLATMGAGAGGRPTIESRPLTVLDVDDRGACWFLVDRGADWMRQAGDGAPATLCAGDNSDGSWLSASGEALVVDDRDRIGELWNPIAEAWFDGVDDPAIAALAVRVHTLAWWESSNSRLVRMWNVATAALGGDGADTGDHGVEQVSPGRTA